MIGLDCMSWNASNEVDRFGLFIESLGREIAAVANKQNRDAMIEAIYLHYLSPKPLLLYATPYNIEISRRSTYIGGTVPDWSSK